MYSHKILFSKKFRGSFKELVIRPILGQMGKEIVYSPSDKIGISDFRNSGIFYVADFGSQFPTEAIVRSNVLEKSRSVAAGNFLQDSIMGKRNNLEDPVFE